MSNSPVTDAPSPASTFVQLLSLASHELRTPASVVGGYLRMLQKDDVGLDERHRRMIDEAAKSCARLVALIGELSEIGKLDGNIAQVKTEAFDLFGDLPGVAAQVHEAADRGVQLRLTGLGTGAPLEGDRERLLAAFGAFFRALLREQPASVAMVADRRHVSKDGTTSAVVVISRESDVERALRAQPQAFDEYRGGVGLSLAIGRRVVERAGGRIWSPVPDDPADRSLRSAMIVSIPLRG